MTDLFDPPPAELPEELRQELMKLSTGLRTVAAKIDAYIERRKTKETDEAGEPTWRYQARVVIPKNFYLTKRMAKYAIDRGFAEQKIREMFDGFVRWYNKNGKKWQDWTRVWMDWVRREQERSSAPKMKTTDRMKQW